jgi:hypothetical protein
MCGSLLVTHQYVVETLFLTSCVVVKRIVNGHDSSAWISEDGFHPLGLQSPHQRFRSSYLILLHIFSFNYFSLKFVVCLPRGRKNAKFPIDASCAPKRH